MKKILIIHTGGTFGMISVGKTKILKPGNLKTEINRYLPHIRKIADIDITIPFNVDSVNINPQKWSKLYQIILKQIDQYDGFVIIHGTDTMIYTAAALSFLLGSLTKPVILTGAQRPLAELRSDAGSNLINAIELATQPIPEVGICFGNKLFRGTRTKKVSIEDYNCFESPNFPPLATIGAKLHLNLKFFRNNPCPVNFMPKYEENIICFKIIPGAKPDLYLPMITSNLKVLILEGFGAGNLPNQNQEWINFIKKAIKSGIRVYIGSQAMHGSIDLNLYLCGKMSREAGAGSIFDMTIETAIVKLMLLLGNFKHQRDIDYYFNRSLVGELTGEST
jgi:L-asparaginase